MGVTEDKFDAMAEDAMKSGNIAVNPRSTSKEDVLMLYKKALEWSRKLGTKMMNKNSFYIKSKKCAHY